MSKNLYLFISLLCFVMMTTHVLSQQSKREAGIEAAKLKKQFNEGEMSLSELSQKIKELYPEDIDYPYIKAEHLFQEKKYTEALEAFEFHTKQFPKALESHIRIAEVKFLLKKKDQAFSKAKDVVKMIGYDLYSLFDFHERIKPFLNEKHEKYFQQVFDKLLKEYGYSDFQASLGNFYKSKYENEKAAEIFDELISQFGVEESISVDDLIEVYMNYSNLEASRDNTQESIDLLSKAIFYDPYSILLRTLRAGSNIQVNKEKACQDAYLLKQLDNGDVAFEVLECDKLNNEIGLPEEKDLNEDIQHSDESGSNLKLAEHLILESHGKETAQSHFYKFSLANALSRDKKNKSALILLKEIENEYSNSAEYYSLKAYIQAEKEDLNLAIKNLEKAISIDPYIYYYYSDLADLYLKNGEYKKSIKLYDDYIALFPSSADAYLSRGNIYWDLNDLDDAQNNYMSFIEIKKSNPLSFDDFYMMFSYINLANIYYAMGNYSNALIWIEHEITKNPKNDEAYNICGKIKAKMNDIEGACEEWGTAKKLGNEHAALKLSETCE